MKKKIPEIIIICFSMLIIGDRALQWTKSQDTNLLLLRSVKLGSAENLTLTARKAHASFYLGTKFLKMPADVEGKDFIDWCKSENVGLVWWTQIEAQSRPLLRTGEWFKEIEVIWKLDNYGFLGKVK